MQAHTSSRPARILLPTAAAVLVMTVIVWITPPLRSFAQDTLNSLFSRNSRDTITVDESQTAGDTTLRDVSSVEAQAGFPVAQPGFMAPGFSLAGAGYTESRQTVSLVYGKAGVELIISQQPAASASYGLLTDGDSGIGPDAPIQQVKIGDVAGEYVAGTWVKTSDDQAVWNPSAPFQRLRWQAGDMIYEILVAGGSTDTGSGLDQQALIAIAVSLQ